MVDGMCASEGWGWDGCGGWPVAGPVAGLWRVFWLWAVARWLAPDHLALWACCAMGLSVHIRLSAPSSICVRLCLCIRPDS